MIERDYEYGGAIVVWKAADSDFELVAKAVEDLGDSFKDCRPSKPTPASSLKMALQQTIQPDQKGHNILVRDLKGMKGRGFVVAQENPQVKGQMRFHQRYAAVFYNDQNYEVEPALDSQTQLLLSQSYQANLSQLGPTSVGNCLADVVRTLGGVPLREAGGVYWLPDDKLSLWKEFAEAVERAGPNRVYSLQVKATPDMIRCVGDQLIAMAETQLNEMLEAVQKDEVNESTVESRKRKLQTLTKQIQDFESAFDRSLDEIRPKLSDAEGALLMYTIIEGSYDKESDHQP